MIYIQKNSHLISHIYRFNERRRQFHENVITFTPQIQIFQQNQNTNREPFPHLALIDYTIIFQPKHIPRTTKRSKTQTYIKKIIKKKNQQKKLSGLITASAPSHASKSLIRRCRCLLKCFRRSYEQHHSYTIPCEHHHLCPMVTSCWRCVNKFPGERTEPAPGPTPDRVRWKKSL